MRISDWSSDVCSSDLDGLALAGGVDAPLDAGLLHQLGKAEARGNDADGADDRRRLHEDLVGRAGQPVAAGGRDVFAEGQHRHVLLPGHVADALGDQRRLRSRARSEEHTSELQSLMRISYAVFCWKQKKKKNLSLLHTAESLRT